MYQYKITSDLNEKAKSVLNTKKNSSDILNKLKEVNSLFSVNEVENMPNSPTFERLKDVEIDNEKIKSQAEEELKEYRNNSISGIEDKYNKKGSELKSNIEDLKETATATKSEISNNFSNLREEASNDALKRGLARSSIVINTLDAFNNKEIETYNKIDKELSNNINAINFELNALTSNYEDALNNFDIDYASKLKEKIQSTTDKLKKQQEEVIKYNNEIAEKEAEFNTKLFELGEEIKDKNFEQNQDVVELYGKYGTMVVDKYKSNRMYDIALNYFSGINKDDALNELNNNSEFKILLGDANYQKLLNALKS